MSTFCSRIEYELPIDYNDYALHLAKENAVRYQRGKKLQITFNISSFPSLFGLRMMIPRENSNKDFWSEVFRKIARFPRKSLRILRAWAYVLYLNTPFSWPYGVHKFTGKCMFMLCISKAWISKLCTTLHSRPISSRMNSFWRKRHKLINLLLIPTIITTLEGAWSII